MAVDPVPKVEKSKSSGFKAFSPVFSKNAFSSFRERNRFPAGPIMKTSYLKVTGRKEIVKVVFLRRIFFAVSYLPAEAPLFL